MTISAITYTPDPAVGGTGTVTCTVSVTHDAGTADYVTFYLENPAYTAYADSGPVYCGAGSPATVTYTFTGVAASATYSTQAVPGVGGSFYGTRQTGTTTVTSSSPPPTPVDATFVCTSTSIQVTVVPGSGGGSATSYEVGYRANGSTGAFTDLTPQAGVTFPAVTGLTANSELEYRLRAVNGAGSSSYLQAFTGTLNPATGGGGELSGGAAITLMPPAIRISEWVDGTGFVQVLCLSGTTPATGRTITCSSSDSSRIAVSPTAVTDSNGQASFAFACNYGGRSLFTFTDQLTGATALVLVVARTITA